MHPTTRLTPIPRMMLPCFCIGWYLLIGNSCIVNVGRGQLVQQSCKGRWVARFQRGSSFE